MAYSAKNFNNIFLNNEYCDRLAYVTQNYWIYVSLATKKHDIRTSHFLCTRATLRKFAMVLLAVSKTGCTNLIFVDTGNKIEKVSKLLASWKPFYSVIT